MALMNNLKMHSEHEEMRKLAVRICKDYLHGAWKDVNVHNIGFKHISGGLSNLLYHISLPQTVGSGSGGGSGSGSSSSGEEEASDDLSLRRRRVRSGSSSEGRRGSAGGYGCAEPREVLIRIYGQTHGTAEGCLEALITESVIFTLLSERGLGPKLHGIFPGGRIEEYINARPLKTKDLQDATLSRLIAEKMAAIHDMEVPLHKEPDWLWGTMDRWMKSCENCQLPPKAALLSTVDVRAEIAWLQQRIEREQCPVTFCHNDMQEGNILICQDENSNLDGEPKLVLIDFEYCSYNYRSFDLANHFLEWSYDYTATEAPFFAENKQDYPTEQQQRHFVDAYLSERCCREDPEKILREVRVLTLASHLFWSLWAVVNADTSKIPFGYWEYAVTRMEGYLKSKADLMQTDLLDNP